MDKVLKLARCMDLTTLNKETDRTEVVQALCQRALEFNVAAVCVYPEFVSAAKQVLRNSTIKVASVANFPTGDERLETVLAEIDVILQSGGDEVDLVFPYKAFKRGEVDYCTNMVSRVRSHCGPNKMLKVILETGELDLNQVKLATDICLGLGADFIKTSTGKSRVSATPEAARVILKEIAALPQLHGRRRAIGFKASGGIKTVQEALVYSNLVEELLGGADAVRPELFRIGASSLLDDIKRVCDAAAAAQ